MPYFVLISQDNSKVKVEKAADKQKLKTKNHSVTKGFETKEEADAHIIKVKKMLGIKD